MSEPNCECTGGKRRTPQYPIRDGSRCKLFWCVGCKQYRPWCCGGSPDKRCDWCVAATGGVDGDYATPIGAGSKESA